MEYRFYGDNERLLYCKDKEVLLEGPAGTGKSVICQSKLMLCALKYAGCRILMVRKTRESMTESTLVTWENKVLSPALYDVIASSMQRRQRSSYLFPNGSTVVVGGMDKPEKILSTEYDIVYINEAQELNENEWEHFKTRIRNGIIPYNQIIGDCNPDAPNHWLNQRCDKGLTTRLRSRHEDNPRYFDRITNTWTSAGKSYVLDTLESLTGVRRQRYRLGIWASSENIVYDDFDPVIHLINRFEIPVTWDRYWVIDFGYRNPFAWLCVAVSPDNIIYVYRQIYVTEQLVSDIAKEIKTITAKEPRPRAIICDHDAEGRATFEQVTELKTIPAIKNVSEGIQLVKRRLATRGDGKPSFYIMRDSLVRADKALIDLHKPYSLEQEFASYEWEITNGKKVGEIPVKQYDHALDTVRYLVYHLDGKPKQQQQYPSAGGTRPDYGSIGRYAGLNDRQQSNTNQRKYY